LKRLPAILLVLAACATTATGPTGPTSSSKTAPGRTVGYIGCSNTSLDVLGYHADGGNRLWDAIREYGGGTVTAWSDPTNQRWASFKAALAAEPTKTIWLNACQHPSLNEAVSDEKQLRKVIANLLAIVPGARIYLSPINDYVAPHVATCIGDQAQVLAQVENKLVDEELVRRGPTLSPLLSIYQTPSDGVTPENNETISDGCHPNVLGQAHDGQDLLRFFG
jgi:hypothetical protein